MGEHIRQLSRECDRLHGLLAEATRERDEARAEIERLKTYIANNISLSKAEERGYRKGGEDAIAAGDEATPVVEQWSFRRAAIFALLEQTAEGIPQKVRTTEQTDDRNLALSGPEVIGSR